MIYSHSPSLILIYISLVNKNRLEQLSSTACLSFYSFNTQMHNNNKVKSRQSNTSFQNCCQIIISHQSYLCLCTSSIFYIISMQEEKDQQLSQPQNTLQRLVNFLNFHSIQPHDIWEHQRYLSPLEFSSRYTPTFSESAALLTIANPNPLSSTPVLTSQDFSALGLWNNPFCKKSLASTLSQKTLSDIKRKSSANRKAQLGESKQNHLGNTIDVRKIGVGSIVEKPRMKTTCQQLTGTFFRSGFGESGKKGKLEALRADLEMNALEKKWEFVVMAGEMNKWIAQAQSEEEKEAGTPPVRFKVVSNQADFSIICVRPGSPEEIVPEVVFVKKYSAMRKKTEGGQGEMKTIRTALIGMLELGKQVGGRLSQRDRQLNQTLLHVMRVKNILQHQHRILSEAAINT